MYVYFILPNNLVLYFTFVILSNVNFFFHILSVSLNEATYEIAGK